MQVIGRLIDRQEAPTTPTNQATAAALNSLARVHVSVVYRTTERVLIHLVAEPWLDHRMNYQASWCLLFRL